MSRYTCHRCKTEHGTENMVAYCAACYSDWAEVSCRNAEILSLRSQLAQAKADTEDFRRQLETAQNPDWHPNPCVICGSPATYDGLEHRVTCDKPECGHWYENRGLGHNAVIRHWNRIPHLEYTLAVKRAEEAEAQVVVGAKGIVAYCPECDCPDCARAEKQALGGEQ